MTLDRFTTALLAALALAPATALAHPLDGLTAAEMERVTRILREAGEANDQTRYPLIELIEPPKADVLAWSEGDPAERRLGHAGRVGEGRPPVAGYGRSDLVHRRVPSPPARRGLAGDVDRLEDHPHQAAQLLHPQPRADHTVAGLSAADLARAGSFSRV